MSLHNTLKRSQQSLDLISMPSSPETYNRCDEPTKDTPSRSKLSQSGSDKITLFRFGGWDHYKVHEDLVTQSEHQRWRQS